MYYIQAAAAPREYAARPSALPPALAADLAFASLALDALEASPAITCQHAQLPQADVRAAQQPNACAVDPAPEMSNASYLRLQAALAALQAAPSQLRGRTAALASLAAEADSWLRDLVQSPRPAEARACPNSKPTASVPQHNLT